MFDVKMFDICGDENSHPDSAGMKQNIFAKHDNASKFR